MTNDESDVDEVFVVGVGAWTRRSTYPTPPGPPRSGGGAGAAEATRAARARWSSPSGMSVAARLRHPDDGSITTRRRHGDRDAGVGCDVGSKGRRQCLREAAFVAVVVAATAALKVKTLRPTPSALPRGGGGDGTTATTWARWTWTRRDSWWTPSALPRGGGGDGGRAARSRSARRARRGRRGARWATWGASTSSSHRMRSIDALGGGGERDDGRGDQRSRRGRRESRRRSLRCRGAYAGGRVEGTSTANVIDPALSQAIGRRYHPPMVDVFGRDSRRTRPR